MSVLILNRNRSTSADWSQCVRCQSNEFWRRLDVQVEGIECVCSWRRFQSHIGKNRYNAVIIAAPAHLKRISLNFDDIPVKDDPQFILLRDRTNEIPAI